MLELIAGIDEAGRGPLAGPLVVAAVILDPANPIKGLGDSKALSARTRQALAPQIRERALAWSVIVVEAGEIDRVNIFQATMAGMCRAAEALRPAPGRVLIDGNKVPSALGFPAQAIVKGDAKEACIGAASILAKTARDALMLDHDQRYPGYGFAQHFGYPTPEHLARLRALGPCAIHRRSYAPVRDCLQSGLFAAD